MANMIKKHIGQNHQKDQDEAGLSVYPPQMMMILEGKLRMSRGYTIAMERPDIKEVITRRIPSRPGLPSSTSKRKL